MVEGVLNVSEAWQLLDDKYGNAEVAVITTLQTLQKFCSSKLGWHECIQELYGAVQHCLSTLSRLGRSDELYSDRQTIASIITQLPDSARDRWVHQPGFPEMGLIAKGKFLVQWLASERTAALQIHLEELSRGDLTMENKTKQSRYHAPTPDAEAAHSFSTQGVSTTRWWGRKRRRSRGHLSVQ